MIDDLYPDLKYVNGPYLRKDGRKHMVLKYKNGKRTSVSYPKWLVEHNIGRRLKDDETIDHHDRDFTNDDLSNLIIKPKGIHVSEDAKRVKLVEITCIWCGEKAHKQGKDLDHNKKLGKAGPFCGRSCAGKYGAAVQNGKPVPNSSRLISQREYYHLEKKKTRINYSKIFSE